MKCVRCNRELATLNVLDKDNGTVTSFCDWSCLAGYVKEKGLLTRDDFPATDRC